MSAMKELLADINKLTSEPAEEQIPYYCCQACGDTYRSTTVRADCPGCRATIYQWPGSSVEEARDRAARARGATTAPEKAEPAAVEKPKRPRAAKKIEEAKPETPAQAPATPAVTTDYAEARDNAISALIEKHNLNEFQPVEVGTATVQTVGFTLWMNKRPVYRFHEAFETAKDFAAAYNEARAEQPATRIDVALCSGVSNPEVEACLFRGELTVGLNSGHGTIQVRRGDTVKVGALKTTTGKLRFVVI